MSKKVSENHKKKIIESFRNGISIEEIAQIYDFTVQTITRQLKKLIGEEEFKLVKNLNSKTQKLKVNDQSFLELERNTIKEQNFSENFFEIAPLNEEFDIKNRKELSSQKISEFNFPKIVYMVVSNNIEIYSRPLKDYPNWEFLPDFDLERKTIEIFVDLKSAKRSCKKDQKVIKVPNTEVFQIVAPILVARGITRIISEDNLIAL